MQAPKSAPKKVRWIFQRVTGLVRMCKSESNRRLKIYAELLNSDNREGLTLIGDIDSDMFLSFIEVMRTDPKVRSFFQNYDEFNKKYQADRKSHIKRIEKLKKQFPPEKIDDLEGEQKKLHAELWADIDKIKSFYSIGQTDTRSLLEKLIEQKISDHHDQKQKEANDLSTLYIKQKKSSNADIKTYAEYSKLFYQYRFEFYRRGQQLDYDRYIVYWYLSENEVNIDHVNALISKTDNLSLTFKINHMKPKEATLNDLAEFNKNAEFFITLLYEMQTKLQDNAFVLDLIRDSAGRAKDRENPSNIFKRWEIYLKAYDMHTTEKLTPTEIGKRILKYEYSDDSNKIHRVEDVLEEAEKLIKSAENGTFPA